MNTGLLHRYHVKSEGMMKAIYQKLIAFFRSFFKKEQPVEPAVEQKKQKRKYNKQRSKDFSELLDNLEITFNSLKMPNLKESWLHRDSIIGLKKLGVHVPNPWEAKFIKNTREITIDTSVPLPSIMCVSIPIEDEKDKCYPHVLFAIKQNKLPWFVAYKPGVAYIYGAAYKFRGELFWVHMYITVNKKTGQIHTCEELRQIDNVIRVNGKTNCYTTKRWSPPNFLQEDHFKVNELENSHLNLFRSMHEWWIGRDERWNVVVKKNGDRVTFGINDKDTPYYFKNREKVVSEDGVTKRIVHYVKEHSRVRNGKEATIKEHIRGLREFVWSGYQCSVISPRLEKKTSASFDAPPEDSDSNEKVVYLSKVGKLLADFEERRKA
jgi:hypothetical protein